MLCHRPALLIRPLVNTDEVAAWAINQGFTDLVPTTWHITIISYRGSAPPLPDTGSIILQKSTQRLVVSFSGIVALEVYSATLSRRHNELKKSACEWRHSTYRQHISFTPYDGQDLSAVRPFDERLVLGPEFWSAR